MLQFPRWRVDVKVDGDLVKTYYETATTAEVAIGKAKHKMRGAVSSAGAFKFTAKKADVGASTSHATKYSEKASEKVGSTMHEFKRGALRSGGGGKVTSRKQAIAIGIAQARRAGYKVPPQGHATKSPAQLDREIAEVLGGRRSHSTKKSSEGTLFAVEIDPHEFDRGRDLPSDAKWRGNLVHLAEQELARGRTYRRPKDARYAVIEWTGYRGAIGRLLDWLEGASGVTRYAEIFE